MVAIAQDAIAKVHSFVFRLVICFCMLSRRVRFALLESSHHVTVASIDTQTLTIVRTKL